MNANSQAEIRLDANLYIPDGGELLLSIDVPREQIRVDSKGPAKVTRVYSDHTDGQWGVGEVIYLFVEFTSSVQVIGTTPPSLVLRTGCHTSSCHRREIQRLRCQATVGTFSVGFADQRVYNIPYNANQRMLRAYLTRMTKIDQVHIDYSIDEDSACTFFGNNITITFESVNIEGNDGDLPELTADKNNVGGDGTKLGHIRYSPAITTQAWEIQKGNDVPDRIATFVDQVDAKTLRFKYIVRPGDASSRLEYVNSDSLLLSSSATIVTVDVAAQQVPVNAKLPPLGSKGDWESGTGSSLSAFHALVIDVSPPHVTNVTSPHDDGIFGIGEVILVHVRFSLPIVATGSPTLVLETGLVDRIIPFVQVLGDGTTAEFQYIVQSKDTSPDLAYAGVNVLELNGGTIKRRSTNPTTNAVLTLPVNGEKGSLSVNKNIVIDTMSPKVKNVAAVTPNGQYTAGDSIEIAVTFDAPVVVTGAPELLLHTGRVDVFPGEFVVAAPTRSNSPKTIRFPAVNHGLTTADSKGLQFEIDGQLLTVDSVNGDDITMLETYMGTIVDPTVVALGAGPSIQIFTPGYRPATYTRGSSTSTLVFRYEVQRGDVSLGLEYTAASALRINSGSAVKRLSTTPVTDADVTLAAPGTATSLGVNSAIVINTDPPRILRADAVTRDGVYRAGDIIAFTITFDVPVVVLDENASSVRMSVTSPSTVDRVARYVRGSGSNVLAFEFRCEPSDDASVFDFVDRNALRASFGSIFGDIRRVAMVPMLPAVLQLPLGGLSSKGISIDQSAAFVSTVTTSHEDATVGAGERVDILLQFSAPVNVNTALGTPSLLLSTTNAATYIFGSGSNVLTYQYTVRIDDRSTLLNYDGIYALRLNGGILTASADQKLVSTVLPRSLSSGLALTTRIAIDTSPPVVLSVTTRTYDGVYTAGDELMIAVQFNAPINVASGTTDGVPTLTLNTGVEYGVLATMVAYEHDTLYFKYTIAVGHSIARLSYFSRAALKCTGSVGLNQDSTLDAANVDSAALGTTVFVAWSEDAATQASKAQIRVRTFNAQSQFPPVWTSEDGGSSAASTVNFDANYDATAPVLVAMNAKMYLAWRETSSATNNPTQIRVAVYAGPQQWRFVARNPATSSGINRDSTQNAASPHLLVHSSKLYAAWHEVSATTAITQVRVAVFNGQDLTPAWKFVDGNLAARGLNYAPTTSAAQHVRLATCRSITNAAVSVLYAIWSEIEPTTNAHQIRVAEFTGTDVAPKWVFVDGNTAFGLNVNTVMSARAPSVVCSGSSLVVAWREASSTAAGGAPLRIRIKQFNGNLVTPIWKSLEQQPLGLNFDSSQSATNVRLRFKATGEDAGLYATWDEFDAVNLKSQIRVARFTGTFDAPSWVFLDGARPSSYLNRDRTQFATRPVLLVSPVSEFSLFAFWQEMHSMTQRTHIRGSALWPGILQWQSIHAACIRRKASPTSMTLANLLLPELNTPGALDFEHAIRIDSSAPVVRKVTLSGDIARVMSTALAVQTIDVFNQASLSQGEFKLVYGGSSGDARYETTCLRWDMADSSLESALEAIPGLALQVNVVKDTSAFHDGHRYVITFAFPSMGLQSLRVKAKDNGDGCQAFTCGPGALVRCTQSSVVKVNLNADVTYRPGVLDALVEFSAPVAVTGTPQLALETGSVDTQAPYTTRSTLLEFDVGTEAASPILRGSFRLSYGDFSTSAVGVGMIRTTECIDIPPVHEDAVQELFAKLKAAVPELVTIGITMITRRNLRNGYRYRITMRNSPDLLDLVPAAASACTTFAGRRQTIDIVSADARILQGEFRIQFGEAISGCIPWNLRAKGGNAGSSVAAASVQNLMSAFVPNRVVPLLVTKDPSKYLALGVRYFVDFLMLDDARTPLRVFADTVQCTSFTCDDGAGGSTTCSSLKLVVNADFQVQRAVSETLAFRYTVQPTDDTSLLTYRDASALSGGTILRASKAPSVTATLALTVPPPSLRNARGAEVTIVSETTIPRVVSVVAGTRDDEYTVGDEVVIFIEFSEAVCVSGTPILELNSKGVASYFAGTGTKILEFRYKVQSGEASAILNYETQQSLLTPGTNARIQCMGDDERVKLDVDLRLPALASVFSLGSTSAIVIDTTAPTILSVSSVNRDTAAGGNGYGIGDIVLITVTFSKEVVVVMGSSPTVQLNSNLAARASFSYAAYRQIIDVGVHATNPISSGQFAVKYGETLAGCIDFNDASSNAASSMKSRLLAVPAIQRIGLQAVTLLQVRNGHRFIVEFLSTQVLDLPLAIEPVVSDICAPLSPTASDAPEMLVVHATDTVATFQYTIAEGDATLDLDALGASIVLPDASTKVLRQSRDPSLDADLTLPATGSANSLAMQKRIVVDGTPVTVVDIISDTAGGTYGVAFPPIASPLTVAPGEILFHVVFSRAVTVVGSPTMELATGSLQPNGVFLPNRFAKFVGQPQDNHVAFLYHILEGDFSSNLAFANVNVLASAEIYGVASTSTQLANTLLPRLTVSGTSTLRIDAHSVPTTVKLSSPQTDGTYGAGEAIEIDVTFSKKVILQTGLNRNQAYFARFPTAVLFDGNIYVLWTEWEKLHVRTKSYLYLRVFSSTTLNEVPTAESPVHINRIPNTFIEKAAMVVWKQAIYAAWDENGLLYCARYNGLTAVNAWTLIPNMGANKNMTMAASSPVLLVHNLILVILWCELAVVSAPSGGGTTLAGQIRVALRNDDDDAPLWIFHDGNHGNAGLNRDPLMDAKDPSAVVFKGSMFAAWSEMNRQSSSYEVVIAKRNVINRDSSTWSYLDALASSKSPYSFISAYRPQLRVRRRGFEDTALLLSWHRETMAENGTEVVVGQVLGDVEWEAAAPLIAGVPYFLNGFNNPEILSDISSKQLEIATCGDTMYAVWMQESITTSDGRVVQEKLGVLDPSLDLYRGWKSVFASPVNHNQRFDTLDTQLICSSTTTAAKTVEMGIFWTEFDGYSTKLRFRHQKIPKRSPDTASVGIWEESSTGMPLLSLDTGTVPPGYATVMETSGLESYVLRFIYIVKAGENNLLNLDALDFNALGLNGAMIQDYLGQIPDYTLLPRANDLRSLSFNNRINIDTSVPMVLDVTSLTPSGEYGVGQQLLLQVMFTAPVTVIASPSAGSVPVLYLRADELHFLDTKVNPAMYIDGSGTKVLTLEYITGERDYCEKLDYFGSDSLALLGDSVIRRTSTFPTTDALLSLPPPRSIHSLSGNRAISIKSTQPRVLCVTSMTPNGTYHPGDTITLQIVFSLPVLVFGAPIVRLETGRMGAFAIYSEGNGTTMLTFTYAIVIGDQCAKLEVRDDRDGDLKLNYVKSLDLANRAQILRLSTTVHTNAVLALPAPGEPCSLSTTKTLRLDSTQPAIIDVRSTTLDGTYDVGEEVELLIEFSRNVVVVGIPLLILNVAGIFDRMATYTSGSGTPVLRFTYVPVAGDNTRKTPLDVRDSESFILKPLLGGRELLERPAQVWCQAKVPTLTADVTLPRPGVPLRVNSVRSLVGNNKKIFIRTDGFRVQRIYSDLENGEIYPPGQRIRLFVVFSGRVVVAGTPILKLNANVLLPTFAVYTGGSGTSELTFQYNAVTGDSCKLLEAASQKALELNGGMITDTDGVYVPLRLGAPLLPGSLSFSSRIEISSVAPTVERVFAKSSNGAYGVGDTIQLVVRFSRRVTFLPNPVSAPPPAAPTLLLQLTAGVRAATYVSGDGSRELLFQITVQVGDSSYQLKYASQTALTGTLFAMATTPTTQANTQLSVPGTAHTSLSGSSSIQIVSSAPRVLRVRAIDRNGTYSVSDRLRLQITYSYPVVVVSTATCFLELSLGNSIIRSALYTGGATTKVLEFTYLIATGDRAARLDYMNQDSFKCTLLQKSAAPTLAASTTLPLPGSDGSLGLESEIRIDPSAPRATSVSSPLSNGVYGAGQVIDISVTFSEPVRFSTVGDMAPRLRLAIANKDPTMRLGAVYAMYTGGAETSTLLFRYVTKVGDMALPLAYDGVDALSMNPHAGGYLCAVANKFRRASLRLPVPLATGSLSNNRDFHVDAIEPPRVIGVGSATPDGVFTAGDTVKITVRFSTPVVVTGFPTLQLERGNPLTPGIATYVSGSGSTDLVFQYAIQVGDHADRLEYRACPQTERRPPRRREWDKLVICSASANALQIDAASSIKRLATTPTTNAVLDLPEVNSWPKLRFHTSRDEFLYVNQVDTTTDILEAERTTRPGLHNEFTIVHQKESILMYSNGIPDHDSSLLESEQLSKEQRYFVELQRFPTQQSVPFQMSSNQYTGLIGMFLNGIPFRNSSSSPPQTVPTDACGGALDEQGRYFYNDLPTCFLTTTGEFPVMLPLANVLESGIKASPLVGYAFDGFPIYGFFDENGELPSDLDACNGRVRSDGQYGYHLVLPPAARPVFMPCLKGIDTTQPQTLRVFRSPVDLHAVGGLTLANLSRFDGLVIDESPSMRGITETGAWLNPSGVSVVYTSQRVIVRSNGVPDGAFGPFPNTYNKYSVKPQNYVFTLPRQPEIQAKTTPLPLDTPIGVMLNGIPFFASASKIYSSNVMASSSPALRLMDKCNGLVDAGGNYRYYASPDCLLHELGDDPLKKAASPLVGYALDGFPLYGPYNEDGVVPTDLDGCNGRIGYDGTYRYHVTSTPPFLLGCFRGAPILPSSLSTLAGGQQQAIEDSDGLYRSLSYGHDLRIQTDPPRILQVYTDKHPGTYVAGETLDIVVKWSVPVTVDTTHGVPSLEVANSSQVAVYTASRSTTRTTVFLYSVTLDGGVGPFNFEYRSQIVLNGARIRRLASTPVLDADLRLATAESLPRFASKHQLVRDVKVNLRGLYHPQASDLVVKLYHETKNALVIGNCCRATDKFGVPDDSLRVNREQLEIYPRNPTSGVGFDYQFQDLPVTAKNLALDGGATALQSSTSGVCAASNAIDGVIDGFVSSQNVARTQSKSNQLAWWELRLLHNTDIGTIRVWLPQEELLPVKVLTLRVDSVNGLDAVDGTFTLLFTTSSGDLLSTDPISYNAVAMIIDEDSKIENPGTGKHESLQAKLSALASMPQLFITRFPADATLSSHGAFTWSITFLGDPKLHSTDLQPLRLGVNAICQGTGVVTLVDPLPGDDTDAWHYTERDDRRESVLTGKLSMFPLWIMLFEDTAMMDVESFDEAHEIAIWVYKANTPPSATNRRVISVNPPSNTKARYIRIMTEKPYAYLTLAEVQVFQECAHLLSLYEGGTPVATEYYPGAEPWSPEDPFRETFGRMSSEGTWTLAIRDTQVKRQVDADHVTHGDGGISDWVLSITNQAGHTKVYHMDIKAHVHTVPRHGNLYVGIQNTEADDHLDRDGNGILDASEANVYLSRFLLSYDVFPEYAGKRALLTFLEGYNKYGGIPILTDASERQKQLSVACDATCLREIGIWDPYFYPGTTGDVGIKLLEIGNDRVVKYVPHAEFRGKDTITFTISIGTRESLVLGTVEIHVRDCEDSVCSTYKRLVRRDNYS